MADEQASSSGSSRLRRVGYAVGTVVGLVLLAAVVLPQFFPPERLKAFVIPPLEEATGRQVQIDGIGLRVLPSPRVRVSNFQLANAEGFGTDPAVSGSALNVNLALWPLFTGTIEPTSVELVDLTVRYQINDAGATNFDTFGAADTAADTTAAADAGGAPAIGVSDFQARNARILYDDRTTGQSATLGFDAQLSAVPDDQGALQSTGTVTLSTVQAVLPAASDTAPDAPADTLALRDATLAFDVGAALDAGRIDLRTLTLETAPLTLRTTGRVTDLNTRPVLDLTVETGDTDLSQLAAFLPPGALGGLQPSGTLQLTTTVAGALPDSTGSLDALTVDGTGRLAGIGVALDGTTLLQDLGADLALSLDALTLNGINGRLLGKPLRGRIAVRDLMADVPQLEGELAGEADLGELSALAAEDGASGEAVQERAVEGQARYDLRFTGSTDPDALRLTGPITLSGVRYATESLREPLQIAEGTLRFTGTGLTVPRMPMQSGENRMTVEATLRNLFPISRAMAERNPALDVTFGFASDRLDLVALLPEAEEDEITYADLFTAQLAGASVNGRPAEEVAEEMYGDVELPAVAVTGDVQIGTLLNEPQRFDDLTMDVRMRNRRMDVENVSARTYGGQLTGSLTLDQSGSGGSAQAGGAPGTDAVLLAGTDPVAWAEARREARLMQARAQSTADTPTALAYDFLLEDAQASAFLKDWTRLGEAVTGTMNFRISGDSPLSDGLLPQAKALTAVGQSVVANGGFAQNLGLTNGVIEKLGISPPSLRSFKRFGGPFRIEDGALRMTEPWPLATGSMEGEVNGALGLGGTVDLSLTARMPMSMVRTSRLSALTGGQDGWLGKALGKIKGDDDTVPVQMALGGTVSDPEVQVDTEALQAALKDLIPGPADAVRSLFNRGKGGG